MRSKGQLPPSFSSRSDCRVLLGWYNKPGVEIWEGKWQDFMNRPELRRGEGFDRVSLFLCHLNLTNLRSNLYGYIRRVLWGSTPVL